MSVPKIPQPLTAAQRGLVFQAWLRCHFIGNVTDEGLSHDEANACILAGVKPDNDRITLPLMSSAEIRRLQADYRPGLPLPAAALSSGVGGSGGYTIAAETLPGRVEINLLAHGPMRQLAEIIRTPTGANLPIPMCDDTANIGEQVGESATFGSSTDPTFSSKVFTSYKWSSKLVKFPRELLEDVPVLVSVLGDILGERLGRLSNRLFTVGNGAATARGIVTAASTVSAASATAISWADIIGLEAAVDPAYREGAAYMMHSETLKAIKNLVDGSGRNRYQERRDPAQPRVLNDYPVYLNADMDSTLASGKKTLLFGQISKYTIRSVGELRLHHLVEKYRDTDAEAMIAYIREDGDLLNAGTAPVKVLVH